MSRDEWLKMWESIKTIEMIVIRGLPIYAGNKCITEINNIKNQIQQEIGQME